ncbi:hypothetical protein IAU59_005123 [Kwoniella sp. CBS 9459]
MSATDSGAEAASDAVPSDYRLLLRGEKSGVSLGSYKCSTEDNNTSTITVLTRPGTAKPALYFQTSKPYGTLFTLKAMSNAGKAMIFPPDHFTTLDYDSASPDQTITHEENVNEGRLTKFLEQPIFGSVRALTYRHLGACEQTTVTFHGVGKSAKSFKLAHDERTLKPGEYEVTIEDHYPNANLRPLYDYLGADSGSSTSGQSNPPSATITDSHYTDDSLRWRPSAASIPREETLPDLQEERRSAVRTAAPTMDR